MFFHLIDELTIQDSIENSLVGDQGEVNKWVILDATYVCRQTAVMSCMFISVKSVLVDLAQVSNSEFHLG